MTDYGPVLEQVREMPLLPEGASVNIVHVDGTPHLTLAWPEGFVSLPVDPQTGKVDPTALRQAIAEVVIADLEREGE